MFYFRRKTAGGCYFLPDYLGGKSHLTGHRQEAGSDNLEADGKAFSNSTNARRVHRTFSFKGRIFGFAE